LSIGVQPNLSDLSEIVDIINSLLTPKVESGRDLLLSPFHFPTRIGQSGSFEPPSIVQAIADETTQADENRLAIEFLLSE
jgi:hypothetical protein